MEISARDIINKDGFYITITLLDTDAATAGRYNVFYTATQPCEVVSASSVWGFASTSGTLDIEKLTGTQGIGAGVSVFKSTISTAGTANTVNTKNSFDLQNNTLNIGDRLALKYGGNITNLSNLNVSLYLVPRNKGHYE